MEHFYENIHGHFDFQDIYSQVIGECNDEDIIVEVGSYLGKSTAFLAVEIINSKKKIDFYVVDTWMDDLGATEEKTHIQRDGKGNIFDTFKHNMCIGVVPYHIKPLQMDTFDASKQFEDNSLKFVFIDSNHEENHVYNELNAWYDKVKVGGIFAGHDYITHSSVRNAVDKFFKEKGLSEVGVIFMSWFFRKI